MIEERSMRQFQMVLALALGLATAGRGKGGDDPAQNGTAGGSGDTTGTATTGANTTPPASTPPATPPPATMSDANIFARMGMTDSMEIEMGKVALSKAKSGDVKTFAQMMVTGHGKMKSEGAALASRLGITPAPM